MLLNIFLVAVLTIVVEIFSEDTVLHAKLVHLKGTTDVDGT